MDTDTAHRLLQTVACLKQIRRRLAAAGAQDGIGRIDRMIEAAEAQLAPCGRSGPIATVRALSAR
jgi:hypothetical protein